ncbi:hypothetical protein [Saccharopolyspora sp. ASAGF58]|uniref:hypothetical protein n=1 Tax=Saccharopolyspora sp. ASAGF58 TaxID=2719023 RepID=UPI00143FD87C|nr:hypothetical protein [Saccharopolyspora sp. ASAGF58]QIZ38932.1 hypothetical protein FDZ84_36125 [Saccharopolyspora sp. ASAGF58]
MMVFNGWDIMVANLALFAVLFIVLIRPGQLMGGGHPRSAQPLLQSAQPLEGFPHQAEFHPTGGE